MIRDPSDIKNSNVWQTTVKSNQASLNLSKRTIIVLGDQKAGKTSFIKLIKGDFDLQAKPTRLIDFYTMRKQGIQIEIYEISSPKFQQVLQFLIKTQNCSHLMIVLCVDLTQPQNLVNKISHQIQNIRTLCKGIIDMKKIDQVKEYNEERSKYYHFIQKNDDIQIIKRMPFRFSIIGCKYDMFEKMKLEQKKWIDRCLRYLAHTNEANLLFSSTKNMQTSAQLRSVFVDELLGIRNKAYSNQKDHNKALFILTGQDKIGDMNLPAFNNSGAFNELKILEQQMQSVFPSKEKIQIPEEEKKHFNSIGLDSLIGKYKKEINSMMREKDIKLNQTSNQIIDQKTRTGFGGFRRTTNQFGSTKMKSRTSMDQNKSKPVAKQKEEQHYMDEEQSGQSQQN